MLRIMRLRAADLAQSWQEAAAELPALISKLSAQLPEECAPLIASASTAGEFINFHTPLSGGVSLLPLLQGKPLFNSKTQGIASKLWEERRALWLKALQPYLQVEQAQGSSRKKGRSAHYIPNAALYLSLLLQYPQHLFVIDGREPVLVPFWQQDFYDSLTKSHPQLTAVGTGAVGATAVAAAAAPTAAAASAATTQTQNENGNDSESEQRSRSHSRAWLWWLLPLLLLLGLGVLYWLFLYPWPWSKSNEPDYAAMRAALEETIARDELALERNLELQKQVALRLELAEQLAANRKLQEQQDLIADTAKTQALLNEIALLQDKVNLKLQAAQQAAAEKAAAEKAAAEKAAAEKAAADAAAAAAQVQAQKQAQANSTTTTTTKLPKCEVIVQNGQMPQLVLASDGSGSMLNQMSDGSLRINAAMQAASALVDKVDKNVPIHLFGLQGCPLARDYGVFAGNERNKLKAAIRQINPRLSFNPLQVMTPLVSGMRGMAGVVPKNVDAVGILISDGVDTCNQTSKLDLCAVAREIHAQKPKLKIHVVLIGDDAPDAKCVADITGGKVYKPNNTAALVRDLQKAGQTLVRVCE